MKIENLNQYEELLKKETCVIDFFAEWCGPCKMLSPIVEQIQGECPEFNLAKLDIDMFSELAEKHQVQSVPTIIFFKNGQEVDRASGFMAKEILIERINKNK